MVPARIILPSLVLFSQTQSPPPRPEKSSTCSCDVLFLALLNCVLLADLLECSSSCDESCMTQEFFPSQWVWLGHHKQRIQLEKTTALRTTPASFVLVFYWRPRVPQISKNDLHSQVSWPSKDNEEEHTMRNCPFRNNSWRDYAFLSVHLGLSHGLQWSTRRLTLDTCLWWLPLKTHQMWGYPFVTCILLVNVHNTKLCVSCVWRRSGQAAGHSTPVIGGTGVYSTPCQLDRWLWRSWQRTSRRWSVRRKADENTIQQGHDNEMRWCANCQAAWHVFLNEEMSRQLLYNYLWNEILQTHTQKPLARRNKWKCLPVNYTWTDSTPNEVGQKRRTADYRCLSTRITWLCSEGSLLNGWPSWSWCCHFSINSVASRKYLISSLSLSSTPQVRECVAAAASLTQHKMKMSAVKCTTQIPFTLSQCGVPALEKGSAVWIVWEIQIYCIRHSAVSLAGLHGPIHSGSRLDRTVREKMVGRQVM